MNIQPKYNIKKDNISNNNKKGKRIESQVEKKSSGKKVKNEKKRKKVK